MIEVEKMEGQGSNESQTTLEGKMFYLDKAELNTLRGKGMEQHPNRIE